MDKLTAWLSPAGRKAIYAALGAIGTILVLLGLAPDVDVANWVEVVAAVLGVAALVLAAVKAKRVDYTAFYAAGAAVVATLVTAGVLNDGQASHIYEILAAAATAVPLVIAALRTNTTVPTGEPIDEYVAPEAIVAREPRGDVGLFG
jgi:hypothetical protein